MNTPSDNRPDGPPPTISRLPRLAQRKPALGSSSNLRTTSSLSDLRGTPLKTSDSYGSKYAASPAGSEKSSGASTTRTPVVTAGRGNSSIHARPTPNTRPSPSIRAGTPGSSGRLNVNVSSPSSLRKAASSATLTKVASPAQGSHIQRSNTPTTPTRAQPKTCSSPQQTTQQTGQRTPERSNANTVAPTTPRSTLRAQIAAKRREMQRSTDSSCMDQSLRPVTTRSSMMDQQGLEEMFNEIDLAGRSSARRPPVPLASQFTGSRSRSSDDPEDLFGRSLAETLVKASRSGKLNVANMGLERFPRELWTGVLGLSEDEVGPESPTDPGQGGRPATTTAQDVFSGKTGFGADDLPPHVRSQQSRSATKKLLDQVPFYEREDLTAIKASGNMLKVVEPYIGMFGALKTLDLRSNMLTELPRNIIDLRELEVLDISYNAFQSLPKSIILLPSLVTLDISHNSLAEVCFLSGERPDQAVLDYRKDNAFLTSFPGTPTRSKFVAEDTDVVLPSLKQMMLQGNKLTNSSLPPVWPENLESLDLSGNALIGQWDVTSLAACPQLKKVVVARNGLSSLIRDNDQEGWRSLESFDLSNNEVRDEEQVAQIFGSRSGFNLVLSGCPLPQAAIRMAHSREPPRAEAESSSEVDSVSAKSCSGSDQQGTGPLKHLYDPVHREMIVDRSSGKDCLSEDREFNLQLVLDAVPKGMTIRKLVLDGVLPLKSLKIPSGESQLRDIKELIIANSSLESTDDLFSSLAEAMPYLEELDLSGSLLTHLKGVDRLVGNGLKKLDVRGARIVDIDVIVEIAKHVRAGTWTGKMSLEELDVRDNAIPSLANELGWLPLRTFMVENNEFRNPSRRHWEKGTPALMQWLRDGL